MKKTPLIAVVALSTLVSQAPLMAADSAVAAPPMQNSSPIAQVGPVTITNNDLKQDAGYQLSAYQAEMDMYNKKKAYLDRKTRDILYGLAAKNEKLSVAEWRKREIDDVVTAPTPEDIEHDSRNSTPSRPPSRASSCRAPTSKRRSKNRPPIT